MFIIQFIRGFCMALADSVPGVSGGTIAFLLGFYDRFISSIDDLITGNVQKKKEAYYYFIHFESETTTPGEIEERIRIMDGVIRYLCVKQEA